MYDDSCDSDGVTNIDEVYDSNTAQNNISKVSSYYKKYLPKSSFGLSSIFIVDSKSFYMLSHGIRLVMNFQRYSLGIPRNVSLQSRSQSIHGFRPPTSRVASRFLRACIRSPFHTSRIDDSRTFPMTLILKKSCVQGDTAPSQQMIMAFHGNVQRE